ncbi:hypothetical protein K7X08_026032 [Anisodus acutangulus]|uniref:NB-ARC domain-containing protein n=1 Tax=Anisodus acutangulus TaxID=402998 RepID=A0A9Q1N1S4_9SOLA|nr:hypothetical protein K7X08_026032 [Anisodus acutangulus]
MCNFELNDSDLSEYMDCLGKNLNDVLMCLELDRSDPSSTNEEILQYNRVLKQVKNIQKKMRFLRYLNATEINGYVDHAKLDDSYSDEDDTDSDDDKDNTDSDEDEEDTYIDEDEDDTDSVEDEDDTDSDEDKDNTDSDENEEDRDIDEDEDDTDSYSDEDDTDSYSDEDDTDSDEDDTDSDEDEDDTDSDEDDTDSDEDDTDSDEDEDDTDSDEDEDDTDEDEDEDEDEDDTNIDEDEDDTNSDEDEDDTDSDEVEDDILSKPPYLLCLIVLVELEMKKIFLGELKASKFTQSTTFKEIKLPKGFSHHLNSLLVYLRNKQLENFPNNISAPNINVALEFLLVFLADVPNRFINGKRLNEVLENVGAIVGDILHLIQNLLPRSIIKNDTSEINLNSVQILEKTANLKAQVEESFLDSLQQKLNGMSKSEFGVDFMMRPHICVLEEFSYLTSAFRDIVEVHHEHEILKDLQKRTINLAYEAEVAIDSILLQYNALWHLFCSLPTILKEIKHISAEVTKIWLENLALKPCYVVEPSKHLPIQHSNLMNDEEIVGFENDIERLIEYLTRGTNELDDIPIVGMGGQGKTTCARKLYNNDIIVSRFDVRAWCIVSQTYNRRKLLQEIFSQVTGSKDKGDEVGELADLLRKSLMGKRYLIVLDDMWDRMAWDDLRLSFPDVGNRSRIVVTTRLEKVGAHVMQSIDPYFLPFLTPEESCQLLQKKVFQQEGCPSELQDVSLAVSKRCKGLPLVVVLAAGIIKKKKMEESWWREVKKALFSYLDCETEDYSRATMLLSYDNLPDHLRPCLLYMGMFPEDARMSVSQLISLWIAEGFVHNIESGTLMEEAAEGYLMDLISSNVVMVSRRRYNGKVKYFQVHDVVLHFCLEKSKEEKFMRPVKGYDSHFQPSEWNESRVSFNFTDEHSKFASVLPTIFWKMDKLRHVEISTAVFDLENNKQRIFEESSKLENLRILRNRCPNLQELDISFKGDICPKLESLTQLQSLHLFDFSSAVVSELHLPSNLNKLVLTWTHIESTISYIAGLPNLGYLQLEDPNFIESKEWCLGDTMFHKLKLLKLVELGISRWDASDKSFPQLETLVIKKCKKLEEIPLSFADIPTLKQIKLIRCKKESLEASAVKIKEEVEDIEGCDRIDIIIKQQKFSYFRRPIRNQEKMSSIVGQVISPMLLWHGSQGTRH